MSPSSPPLIMTDLLQDIPSLEADLAFCEARLSLLHGRPDSLYLRAQLRIFNALGESLRERLERMRREAKREAGVAAD